MRRHPRHVRGDRSPDRQVTVVRRRGVARRGARVAGRAACARLHGGGPKRRGRRVSYGAGVHPALATGKALSSSRLLYPQRTRDTGLTPLSSCREHREGDPMQVHGQDRAQSSPRPRARAGRGHCGRTSRPLVRRSSTYFAHRVHDADTRLRPFEGVCGSTAGAGIVTAQTQSCLHGSREGRQDVRSLLLAVHRV